MICDRKLRTSSCDAASCTTSMMVSSPAMVPRMAGQKGELFYSFYTSGVLYMLFLFSLLESCLFFYVIGDCFRMSLVNVDII